MHNNERRDAQALARLSTVGKKPDRRGGLLAKFRRPAAGSERRDSKREEDRFPVELESESGERFQAHTVNISRSGLALECETENAETSLREGASVSVVLTSPFLGVQTVQIRQEFKILTCEALHPGTLQLRLRSLGDSKKASASARDLNPHAFVLPAEQEDIFMQIQAQMNLQLAQAASKVLVFTAADWRSGTSTISWWYAVCLARKSLRRVLFIDGNVLAKSRRADDEGPAGFVDLLLGKESLENTVLKLSAGAPDLLNVGRVDRLTSSEISSSDVRTTFELLREHYDYIIVDAPPAAASSITMLWAQSADGCMLVLEAAVSQRDAAQNVVTQLRQAKVSVVGAVLNKAVV